MRLIELNWDPDDRQLRHFGIICSIVLPLMGLLNGGPFAIRFSAAVGILAAIEALVSPKSLKPFYIVLTIVAAPIGIMIGELAMLLVYFGMFLPIGLLFRVIKRDALQLKSDRRTKTYWQAKKQPRSPADYYRQS